MHNGCTGNGICACPRETGESSRVHPTAIIGGEPQHFQGHADLTFTPDLGDDVKIGPFTTVDAGTVRHTYVGARTYVMGHTNVGHDVLIGEDCEISDSCVIGGHAELGDGVRVGFGSMILPYRTIGDGARIGAGSVVTHDVPAGETWAGNPARKLEKSDPRPHSERS